MTDDLHHDPELDALLRARSGGPIDVSDAYASVLARSRTIRRRRTAAGAGALIALVVAGIALLPRGGDAPIPAGEVDLPSVDVSTTRPADGTDDADDADAPLPLPVESDDGTPRRPLTTIDDTPPVTANRSAGDETPTVTTQPSTASVTTVLTTTAPTPATTVPTTTTPTTTVPTTTVPTTTSVPSIEPFTRTYDSLGGSITVSWSGTSLALGSIEAAAGFTAEIEHEEPLRVRVRFRSDDADSRIEVRISDGVLVEEIS